MMHMHSSDVIVRAIRMFRGPNLYAHMPVMQATLDIGPYAERSSNSFPGCVERLSAWLPGLAVHECSLGRPGGFLERMRRGTYLAHTAEYLALELQAIMGFDVSFGRAVGAGERGVYHVIVAYHEEEPARQALHFPNRIQYKGLNPMTRQPKGTLIIIGGHEDKEGDCAILTDVARRVGDGGRLVLFTVATELPEEVAATYRETFGRLGVKHVDVLDIRSRDEAGDEQHVRLLDGAPVVFFTGGDQLRITSQIGDSRVFQCLREIYHTGGTIVGTSAGAAAMPETMLVGGAGDESHRLAGVRMAPGLGFLPGVVVDSHFAERGRIGRLLGAVVQNPRNVGLGIDEDTAIVVERGRRFRVLGSGAVYVADGAGISYSSLSEHQTEGVVSIHDTTLHVLGDGDSFDLAERRPIPGDVSRRKEAA
jgi:cyanophycinase